MRVLKIPLLNTGEKKLVASCMIYLYVSNALHALMSFSILLSHVSFNQICHIYLWPFPFNHPEGGILAKPLTATRVQKGLRLPALATTSWSRTSSVLTTTDSLPVDTGSGAQAPELTTAQLLLP